MRSPRGAWILVVDDERAIRRALESNLARHGFRVDSADSGRAAFDQLARGRHDLVVLDLALPDADGLEIIRTLRARSNVPIIVLSVRGAERDKVEALNLGADDYVTKPFGADELVARVRVALRHATSPPPDAAAVFHTGEIEVDLEHSRVRVAGRDVHVTPTEYELHKVFVANPNKLLTDRMLLQRVWGPEYGSENHYLHVYLARLRKKLEPDPSNRRLLRTEPGVGYRPVVEESSPG